MKKVLFCTDLSKSCHSLSEYIADWVKGTDVIVDVIHVYDPAVLSLSTVNIMDQPDIKEETQQQMNGYLDSFLESLPKENRGQKHLLADKAFSTTICMTADKINADLIVSGLREKYTMMDKFMGSTAASLIKTASLPVLVIPYERSYSPYKTVLFPTQIASRADMSIGEEDALTWIYDHMDKDADPAIHLLHIEQDKAPIPMTNKEYPYSQMKFTTSYSPDVVMGIIDHLEQHDSDLIAVHRTEKSMWDRIHKSSVAKNLMYKSKMPILFI